MSDRLLDFSSCPNANKYAACARWYEHICYEWCVLVDTKHALLWMVKTPEHNSSELQLTRINDADSYGCVKLIWSPEVFSWRCKNILVSRGVLSTYTWLSIPPMITTYHVSLWWSHDQWRVKTVELTHQYKAQKCMYLITAAAKMHVLDLLDSL